MKLTNEQKEVLLAMYKWKKDVFAKASELEAMYDETGEEFYKQLQEDTYAQVFGADYLVMHLADVYGFDYATFWVTGVFTDKEQCEKAA